MNKKLFIFAMCELMLTVFLFAWSVPKNKVEYSQTDDIVRVHIVANSNSNEDMRVKSNVKEYLMKELYSKGFESSLQTVDYIQENSACIQESVLNILEKAGFEYGATVSCGKEQFPVRLYGDVLTDSGIYETVKIVLGEGKGDNWWCIAYPTLCVNKEKKVTFRSRIAEWWKRLFG